MNVLTLDGIRHCLEGTMPAFLATCDADGMPNASEISQVDYVDISHVALSYQFFNKTRRNVLSTRKASVIVNDPDTNALFRLALEYVETQTEGAVFDKMRVRLAGIASHSGMQDVFRLLGSDIYRVSSIVAIDAPLVPRRPTVNLLSAALRVCDELTGATDLETLFARLLAGLERHLEIRHAMVLMTDAAAGALFTIASRGYPSSGTGAEIAMGDGVIGVAALSGVPIRIGHMAQEYSYGATVRQSFGLSETDHSAGIPYPGLTAPMSQVALPIRPNGQTLGIIFAESPEPNRFGYDEEDALAMIAGHLGLRILLVQQDETPQTAPPPPPPEVPRETKGVVPIRYYRADGSIFIGNNYLIKGVAGAILWKLVQEFKAHGRVEFTNRELRLDPSLKLPAYTDNLEARLLLLQRRLSEKGACLQIRKCGRGSFRLETMAELVLESI